jgi:membrane fusion protein (multidrug efflux system)
VTVGDWRGENWVIQAGLKGGERVVVDGLLKLGPGAQVRIAAPQSAGAPASKAPATEQKK